MRKPYLPGAEVWSDPRAEPILARITDMRRLCYGMPPLVREKASTEDVIRECLQDKDKFDRWMRRQSRARE
jgi:hypothetical protein